MEGVFQTTLDGRFISANPALAKLLGYDSPQELIKQITHIGRQLYVTPEDRETYRDNLEAEGVIEGFEAQLIKKDGSPVWASISARVVRNDAGEVIYYEGTIEDITKQKQADKALKVSKARLSSIIGFLPDATLVIDLEGRIISWNRAVEEMTGFSAETMLGRGDYEYTMPFYGSRRPILVDFLFSWSKDIERRYSFIHNEGDTLFTETDIPCVRGQERTLWARASPLRDDRGNIIGAIESIRDVTERKQTEEVLRESEGRWQSLCPICDTGQEIDRSERVLIRADGERLPILKTVVPIRLNGEGYASLMMLELDTRHPHYERLKRIEEQVHSAADLTRQLLGFARGGRHEMRPLNMNNVIKKSASMFGRTKKDFAIRGKYKEDLWTVEADQGQVEQVLLNLYVNAWHAMPTGGKLYLETKNVTPNETHAALHGMPSGAYVRISVTDTGMGMDAKTRKRIFDPFFFYSLPPSASEKRPLEEKAAAPTCAGVPERSSSSTTSSVSLP